MCGLRIIPGTMGFFDGFEDAYDALAGIEDPKKPLTKAQQRNRDNFGSITVTDHLDHNGISYFSSITGNYYKSPEEAVADEQRYLADPKAWASAGMIDPTAAATGQQTPVQNPSGEYYDDPAAAFAAAEEELPLPAPPPPPPGPPPPPATRAGFTDELPPTNRITTRRRAPPIDTPFDDMMPGVYVDPKRLEQTVPPGAPPPGTPPNAPPGTPVTDRTYIDDIFAGLDTYEDKILELAGDQTGLSAAEAQLNLAHEQASQRARNELAANQSGALGMARSARNAGDARLLERQAVGEQAYLATQAQRQQSDRDAELPLELAILRAKETEADRTFKLEAITAAAGLGLNRAALEVDLSKANLASAQEVLKNDLQVLLQRNAIDEAQYEALLEFTTQRTGQFLAFAQTMAAIQQKYDQMNVDDQNYADGLMMQKYGIDQNVMVALKKIKEDGKFQWDQVLSALVGGAATGATGGITALIAGSGGGGGGESGAPPVVYDYDSSN